MKNLVSGENRLQGVLGGDIITFLKGVLIKEIIKSVNIWKGDLMDQIYFLLVKTWASLNLQQIPVVYICTSDIDHMTIVKRCMISVKFWHQSWPVNRQMMQLLVSLRIIGLSSETHMENSLLYDQNIFTCQGLTICSSPL